MIREKHIIVMMWFFVVVTSSAGSARADDTPRRYLIITADSLVASFEDFAFSKVFKGYDVRIKSLEDIYADYSQYTDTAEMIKRYIKDYYDELQSAKTFVLLGGNERLIPTRTHCAPAYGYTNDTGESMWTFFSISTDLYYACLGWDLDWDANGNGIYAEVKYTYITDTYLRTTHTVKSDHASICPSLILSRLPVGNKSDISGYMKKLSKYERGEVSKEGFYDRMLFAGAKANYYKNGKSDSNHIGDSIVDNIIHVADPDISVSNLYDTNSSFAGKSFMPNDLNEVLYGEDGGYNVMNVFTHGQSGGWRMQDTLVIYDYDDCATQEGDGAAVIVSASCYTADFLNPNSLGMAFILNPNNNTVAYWGNTNAGWVNPKDSVHGASYKFVECLFSNLMNNEDVSIGSLIDTVHSEMSFDDYEYSKERYIWLSSALLGDAEMKVYKRTPNKFNPFNILISGGYALMDPYYTNAHYSLVFNINQADGTPLDYTNMSPSFEHDNAEFLFDSPFQIGITKDGYAPYRSDKDGYNEVRIQGTTLTNESLLASRYIIGRDVSTDANKGWNSIAAGGNVRMRVRESLTINDCFECPVGATLNIETIK